MRKHRKDEEKGKKKNIKKKQCMGRVLLYKEKLKMNSKLVEKDTKRKITKDKVKKRRKDVRQAMPIKSFDINCSDSKGSGDWGR